MTPEQQRIAIAEACGWNLVEDHPDYLPYWEDPKGNMVAVSNYGHKFPDYLNDLNAMHEAEKVLTADEWYEYDSMMPLRDPQKIHATARQRAEAFLRTIGKWTENPNKI
jgi:hypothetical protein